jgi:hypothetical protein
MSNNKRENGIGLAKGVTWGTSVEPGVGEGIYLLTHNPPKGDRALKTNKDEFDHDLPTAVYPMDFPEQSGSMGGNFYYEGLERLMAAWYGIYGSSAPESGVVKHEFTFDPIIGSIFFTIAYDEGDEIKAIPSAKIKSGRIYFDDGLKFEANYGGDRSVVTLWSDPLPITYPSDGKGIFRMLDSTCWINAQAGADFATGDIVNPTGMSLDPSQGYKALPVAFGAEGISEHQSSDAPEFTIALNFGKKDSTNAAFIAAFAAGTKKKMRIKMEGATISGKTSKYTMQFDFPCIYVIEAPTYSQDTPIPVTVKFGLLRPAATPTGMSGVMPYASIINEVPALTGYPAS